jgi:hypothetical protein
MSWFGFGGKKEQDNSTSLNLIDSENEDKSFHDTNTQYKQPQFSAPISTTKSNFEQELQLERQKAMVQAVVFKLTEISFDSCVQKPSQSLSSTEKACIFSTVGKYLDTSELVVGRLHDAKPN